MAKAVFKSFFIIWFGGWMGYFSIDFKVSASFPIILLCCSVQRLNFCLQPTYYLLFSFPCLGACTCLWFRFSKSHRYIWMDNWSIKCSNAILVITAHAHHWSFQVIGFNGSFSTLWHFVFSLDMTKWGMAGMQHCRVKDSWETPGLVLPYFKVLILEPDLTSCESGTNWRKNPWKRQLKMVAEHKTTWLNLDWPDRQISGNSQLQKTWFST